MSTFYAVFSDPSKARLAVISLLSEGVPTDDISLVARGDSSNAFVNTAEETETSAVNEQMPESPVGMGISSAEFNDAADSVDQTDDPQWLAEDSLEMQAGESQADLELRDLDMAVNTGYPTTPEDMDRREGETMAAPESATEGLEAITVPGFGIVIGAGPLATAALDYGDGDPSDDVEEMMKHFREEGVPDDVAQTYVSALDKGEALLAVGLIPGEVEPPLVETVAEQFGGKTAATFDAPRY